MKPGAFIGALVGAVLGAAVWSALAIWTDTEFGIVAWGTGGVIGMLALLGGGRGPQMGAVCAVFALASIFFGKTVAIVQFMDDYVAGEELFTTELYNELREDARIFADLTEESAMREFMVTRNYTDATTASEITDEEWNTFQFEQIPRLRELGDEAPSYEQWRDEQVALARRQIPSIFSGEMISLTFSSLGFLDFVFLVFGLGTAFGMVARADEGA